jgi:hypothetical protein
LELRANHRLTNGQHEACDQKEATPRRTEGEKQHETRLLRSSAVAAAGMSSVAGTSRTRRLSSSNRADSPPAPLPLLLLLVPLPLALPTADLPSPAAAVAKQQQST